MLRVLLGNLQAAAASMATRRFAELQAGVRQWPSITSEFNIASWLTPAALNFRLQNLHTLMILIAGTSTLSQDTNLAHSTLHADPASQQGQVAAFLGALRALVQPDQLSPALEQFLSQSLAQARRDAPPAGGAEAGGCLAGRGAWCVS